MKCDHGDPVVDRAACVVAMPGRQLPRHGAPHLLDDVVDVAASDAKVLCYAPDLPIPSDKEIKPGQSLLCGGTFGRREECLDQLEHVGLVHSQSPTRSAGLRLGDACV